MRQILSRLLAALAAALWLALPATAAPLFTAGDIAAISPRADPALVAALAAAEPELAAQGIDTPLRAAHFLAQIMAETGGLVRLDENMNYSAERLLKVFTRKVVTPEDAARIARKPEQVANWVYRNRLGNGGPETGDGWAYRGSGYIQLTGRSNFRLRGEETGLPLEENPDLARRPAEGLAAALAYWRARDVNRAADANDGAGVRRLVNGPRMEGLPAARGWFNRVWTLAFQGRDAGLDAAISVESGGTEGGDLTFGGAEAVADMLDDYGFGAGSTESGSADPAESLREFQAARGLNPTGTMDEATFYALTDPVEWRRPGAEDMAEAPLADPDGGSANRLAAATPAPAETAPETGTGGATAQPLDAQELATLAEAEPTYSVYETAEGRRVNGRFVPFTVIGDDDREAVMDTTAYPARAIVQIVYRKRAGLQAHLCTGTMIGPDLVLTAGHCVHGGTRAGRWYTEFEVIPGRNTGAKPFGACAAVETFALNGWTAAATTDEARHFDLGVIRLDCEIGRQTGWLGLRAMGDDALNLPVTVQGYPADKAPEGRQWRSEGTVAALLPDKAFYQNDTFGGTSGAPVTAGAEPWVICVHTNGRHGTSPWAENNACTRLTPARLATIAQWRGE